MKLFRWSAAVVCAFALWQPPAASAAEMNRSRLSWSEVEALPLPPASERIAYGDAPEQFGELRLPSGEGPFAVVMLIHGGCWLSDFDYAHLTRVAAALTHAGYATWTVEYRRLGNDGGGWPGTFLDVAQAADHLRPLAKKFPLDLKRVVAVGHSAGGQLALWLAARAGLPEDSALYRPQPLPLTGVIGLAAITDLATYRIGDEGSCHSSVDPLLGGAPAQVPERYAQTSPLALLPLHRPIWLIQGDDDPVVEPASAAAFIAAAQAKGDRAILTSVPTGHFELVVPQGAAYEALLTALAVLLRP